MTLTIQLTIASLLFIILSCISMYKMENCEGSDTKYFVSLCTSLVLSVLLLASAMFV